MKFSINIRDLTQNVYSKEGLIDVTAFEHKLKLWVFSTLQILSDCMLKWLSQPTHTKP